MLPDSPAIDAGSNALAVDADGVPLQTDRVGNPRIQNGVVDLGAVEGAAQPSDPVTYVVENLSGGAALDGTLSFEEAFQAANSNQRIGDATAGSFGESDRITFATGVSGTVHLNGQTLTVYGDLIIDGPGADRLTFDGQRASGVMKTIAGTEVSLHGITITGGQSDRGGGISNSGTLTITNSMVGVNEAPEDPDVAGALAQSSDYSLIGVWSGEADPPANTLFGTPEQPLDPRVGPLGDYGGTTWTMPLPGENTGLVEPDVFYFGNAIGESGSSTSDAKVNAFDMLERSAGSAETVPVEIDWLYQFDRADAAADLQRVEYLDRLADRWWLEGDVAVFGKPDPP